MLNWLKTWRRKRQESKRVTLISIKQRIHIWKMRGGKGKPRMADLPSYEPYPKHPRFQIVPESEVAELSALLKLDPD